MHRTLVAAILALMLTCPAWATPAVTLGAPLVGEFATVEPGSIRVDGLSPGEFVDVQIAVTIHPFCIRALLLGLDATGDGGAFSLLTEPELNGCGGQRSDFDIQLAGDGVVHAFDVDIVDADFGGPMTSIPVQLLPLASDLDGDGVPDVGDNCVEIANADQHDSDADDIGNACDPDVAVPNDCVVNSADLGVYKLNFFQPGDLDTDNNADGVTNAVDLGVLRAYFFGPPGPSGIPNACTQLGPGEVCEPGVSMCAAGLSCCYPCGVPGCDTVCVLDCDPANPLCVDGCLVVP